MNRRGQNEEEFLTKCEQYTEIDFLKIENDALKRDNLRLKNNDKYTEIDLLKVENDALKRDNLRLKKSFDSINSKCNYLTEFNERLKTRLRKLNSATESNQKEEVTETPTASNNETDKNNCQPKTEPSTEKKVFECATCEKTFNFSSQLIRHSKTHNSQLIAHSNTLNNSQLIAHSNTPNNSQLIAHANADRAFDCNVCQERFVSQKGLDKHVRLHSTVRPFGCDRCKKRFLHPSHLASHVSLYCHRKPYCAHCKVYFNNSRGLLNHLRTHKGNIISARRRIKNGHRIGPASVTNKCVCKFCNQRLSSSSALRKHLKIHERGNDSITGTSDQPQVTIPTVSEDIFCCEFCKKYFTNGGAFQNHMRTHGSDELSVIQSENSEQSITISPRPKGTGFCKYCKISICPSNFQRHMLIHKNGMTYKSSVNQSENNEQSSTNSTVTEQPDFCKYCQKHFTTGVGFRRHMGIHENEPTTYESSINQCENNEQSDTTSTHAETTHRCKYCKKCFSNRGNLTTHLKMHERRKVRRSVISHSEKSEQSKSFPTNTKAARYFCRYCKKYFTNVGNFRSHVRKHEKNKTLESSTSQSQNIEQSENTPTYNEKVHYCEHCTKYFTNEATYDSHMKIHKQNERHKSSISVTKNDKQSTTPTHDEPVYYCKYCIKYFLNGGAHRNHMKTHEKKETCNLTKDQSTSNQKSSDAELAYCKLCDKLFCHMGALTNHLKAHERNKSDDSSEIQEEPPEEPAPSLRSEKSYCKYCAKYFGNLGALSNHQKKHERLGDAPILSDDTNQAPSPHITSVHSEKTFCKYCSKHFFNVTALKSHLRMHSRLKQKSRNVDNSQNHISKKMKFSFSAASSSTPSEQHCSFDEITIKEEIDEDEEHFKFEYSSEFTDQSAITDKDYTNVKIKTEPCTSDEISEVFLSETYSEHESFIPNLTNHSESRIQVENHCIGNDAVLECEGTAEQDQRDISQNDSPVGHDISSSCDSSSDHEVIEHDQDEPMSNPHLEQSQNISPTNHPVEYEIVENIEDVPMSDLHLEHNEDISPTNRADEYMENDEDVPMSDCHLEHNEDISPTNPAVEYEIVEHDEDISPLENKLDCSRSFVTNLDACENEKVVITEVYSVDNADGDVNMENTIVCN